MGEENAICDVFIPTECLLVALADILSFGYGFAAAAEAISSVITLKPASVHGPNDVTKE